MSVSQAKDLLLQGSDVFALPSHSENFGISVAGALISGLPVVITPGIRISPEIQTADAGMVVEADAYLFADGISQVVSQPRWRNRLRENGLRLASTRYSWSAIAQELYSTYKNLLSKESARTNSRLPKN